MKTTIRKTLGPSGKANGSVFFPLKDIDPKSDEEIEKLLLEIRSFIKSNSVGSITVSTWDDSLEMRWP